MLAQLRKVGPLEIYSGVGCDVMVDLVEEGVLTRVRASSPAACSKRFYDFLMNDSRIQLIPRDRMLDPFEIANLDNVCAVNVTMLVDLLGQACSEAQGLKPYSGIGGSFAYIYGAMRSKGGRSFTCLRSTYKDKAGACATAPLSPGCPRAPL